MLGDSQEALLFLEGFLHSFPYFVCYLPMALPTMLSFKNKIQGHLCHSWVRFTCLWVLQPNKE